MTEAVLLEQPRYCSVFKALCYYDNSDGCPLYKDYQRAVKENLRAEGDRNQTVLDCFQEV